MEISSRGKHMLQGSCFCGEVKFSIDALEPEFYQCHCSKCRKVTGSNAVTAFMVPIDNFHWDRRARISSFTTGSGYRVDFCQVCGSTVPNPSRAGNAYWVPVGLIDNEISGNITKHIYVGSKASWDVLPSGVIQHAEGPE